MQVAAGAGLSAGPAVAANLDQAGALARFATWAAGRCRRSPYRCEPSAVRRATGDLARERSMSTDARSSVSSDSTGPGIASFLGERGGHVVPDLPRGGAPGFPPLRRRPRARSCSFFRQSSDGRFNLRGITSAQRRGSVRCCPPCELTKRGNLFYLPTLVRDAPVQVGARHPGQPAGCAASKCDDDDGSTCAYSFRGAGWFGARGHSG